MEIPLTHTLPVSADAAKDAEQVNTAIRWLAGERRTAADEVVTIKVIYAGEGDDIVRVHPDGELEVVDDGA